MDSLSLSFSIRCCIFGRHKIEPRREQMLSRERVVIFSEIGNEKRRNEVTPDWERLSHLALFVPLLVCIRNASQFSGTSKRGKQKSNSVASTFHAR
jgi:hypothetical protein